MEESDGETSDKELDTRKLVTQRNKKKKSGGFQSMGKGSSHCMQVMCPWIEIVRKRSSSFDGMRGTWL